MSTRSRVRGRWKRAEILFDFGLITAVGIAIFSFSKDRLLSAFIPEGITHFPLPQLSLLLLIETLVLLLLWVRAVSGEKQMLRDYLAEFIPPLPKASYQVSLGLAALLGILSYFSDTIVIYSAIFVFFKLFEIWGIRVRDSSIKSALSNARAEVSDEYDRSNAWSAIESYYLGRPQTEIAMTVMFFSFVSFTLGLTAQFPGAYPWLTWIAYVVMILTIAFPELLYVVWRRKRDAVLGEPYY